MNTMALKHHGHVLPHYHNSIKSTNNSAVYQPKSSIISEPLANYYTVGENIGRGKFAVVKKCTNNQTGEVVAAKFIKKRRRGKSCREEILREVVMLEMALDHPRLVNLKEVFETQQELILITEYCAGGELFTECILEEKFDEADVRILMTQILEGLHYLHEKNIVHLDLKPQNILLTDEFPQGSVKICDLGFACMVNTGEDIRDIIGTPDYVAPEVLNYDSLGLYTDMWSLGVLTYVMLTTCSPFSAEDKQMTFSNITNVNLDFPDDLFGDISIAAQDFIQKLLISEPGERMTAKECFEHAWITGTSSPSKPLPSSTSDTVKDSTSGINEVNKLENGLEETENSHKENCDSGDFVIRHQRENSREKIADQHSEMSVSEAKDDEGVVIDPESDPEALEQIEIANANDSVSETSNIHGVDFSPIKSSPPAVIPTDTIKNGSDKTGSAVESGADISPDTDSSMCITDSKLQDVDSGMLTGSDCKSTESVNISGRTSVDHEATSIADTDYNSEVNEDVEMMNKSTLENDMKHLQEDTDTACLSAEQLENVQEQSDDKLEPSEGEKDDIHSDIENEMDVEVTDSPKDGDTDNINQNSLNEDKVPVNQHPKDSDHLHILQSDEKGFHFPKNLNDQVFDTETTTLVNKPTQPSTDTRVPNSVSNIDDSINSMQLGERLKRGMCNEPEKSGADNPDNIDEQYEFVSVSKRVRSIEDTLDVNDDSRSPPNCNPKSPKIARSPRIARHQRHYQHH